MQGGRKASVSILVLMEESQRVHGPLDGGSGWRVSILVLMEESQRETVFGNIYWTEFEFQSLF